MFSCLQVQLVWPIKELESIHWAVLGVGQLLAELPLIFWQLSKTLLTSLTDIEVIAGEDSLAVKVNILKKTRLQHLTELKNFLGTYQPEFKVESSELITVPICYDIEFALDMSDISLAKGLSKEEVIDAHCGIEYQVKMIGFTPVSYTHLTLPTKRIV